MNPSESAFEQVPDIHVAKSSDGARIDAVGDRYRFLLEGEQSNDLYAMWHATITPGGGPPLHSHAYEDEAFYVLKGEILFETDGESFAAKAGSFVNLPIGSRHRFENKTQENAEVLIIVAPAGLEKMFRQTGCGVADPSHPIAKPNEEEKQRLGEIAPQFGIALNK